MASTDKPLCPRCGQECRLDGLCQACLLRMTFDPGEEPGALEGEAAEEATHREPGLGEWDDYTLLQEIASGGMGVVYRARQRGLNRLVAIKMVRGGQLARPEDVARFRVEAEAAARLQHPNIVAIHEIGEHDGQPWFSMELVEGLSLATLARRNPLEPRRAAAIVRDVAGAIQHAHDRGILHRDIKPSNILLAAGDVPRVTDFGLAKILHGDIAGGMEATQTGGILGSPAYLSPEQAAGRSHQADVRSDVYSLGTVLYELLTGRPPFQTGSPMETLKLVLETEPVPPRRLNPGIPRDLETICLKAMRKDPASRYATAQSFGTDLSRWLEGRAIEARPASVAEHLWRWSRRKPALAGSLVALVLAIAGGGAGVTWQWRRATALAGRETQQRLVAERSAYTADMLLVNQALKERNFGYAADLLTRHDPSNQPDGSGAGDVPHPDFRNWEWRHFQSQIRSDELFTLGVCSNFVKGIAVAPDGRDVAVIDGAGWVTVWDSETRKSRPRILMPATPAQVRFSPDSRRLLVSDSNGDSHLFNLEDGTIHQRFQSAGAPTSAFSEDGRLIYLAAGPRLVVHEVDSGREVRSIPLPDGGALVGMDAAPKRLGILKWEREVLLWNLDTLTGVTNQQPLLKSGFIVSFNLSPDGRHAVATYNDNAAWVWDFETGALRHELRDHKAIVYRTAFSPDSRLMATAGMDQVIGLWSVESGTHLGILKGHRAPVTMVAFFPDGRRLVSGGRDRTVRVWDVTRLAAGPSAFTPARMGSPRIVLAPDGSLLWRHIPPGRWVLQDPFSPGKPMLEGSEPDVRVGAPGPKGLRFALGYRNGTIETRIRKEAGFVVERTFTAHTNGLVRLAYSMDGRYLASIGGDGAFAIWDAASQDLLRRIPPNTALGAPGVPRFSDDGSRITVENRERGSFVLEWRTGKWAGPFHGHAAGVTDSAVSPDGTTLAVVSFDGVARLWDLTGKGRPPRTLETPSPGAWSLAFFPDGQRLAVGLDTGEMVVWDLVAGREVTRLFEAPIPAIAMAYNADHDALVTVSMDGVRLWRGRAPQRAEAETEGTLRIR